MEGSGGKGVVVGGGGDHHHQYHPKYYKKGLWTEEEDKILMDYIMVHGKGKWNRVAKVTGLKRCGKSCRLRWMNYLSPNVKRGDFSEQEEDLIIRLHKLLGNRWSLIAGRVPGRTDNQVKNHWNTHLSKKLGIKMGMMINKRKAGSIVVSSSKDGDHDDNSARDIKKLKLIMTTDQDQDQEEEEEGDSNDDTHKLQTFESNIAAGGNSTTTITSTAAGYDQFSNNIHPSNYDGQEPVLTVAAAATAAGGGEMDDQCNFFLSSFWFFNNNNEGDQLYHCLGTAASDAPKLLEIPDGYPLDMVWHGCP